MSGAPGAAGLWSVRMIERSPSPPAPRRQTLGVVGDGSRRDWGLGRSLPALLVAALLTVVCARSAGAQSVDTVLATAMRGRSVPGMAVLLLRNGAVAGQAVRGVRALDAPDRVTPADVWHIGSDTKAMTATMIARLVERGVLAWDAPLPTLLPVLAAGMQPAYRGVTLHDLFSHQAGLPANVDLATLDAFRQDPRPIRDQRLAYARLALGQPPAYVPRTGDLYSNSGPVIAAVAAEQATGLTYEELMRREVFAPLGMTSAAFGPTHRGEPLGHAHGTPMAGREADNARVLAPAGEIHLSMRDWGAFALDQMAGEHGRGRLLRPATYRLLHTPGRTGSTFALGWALRASLHGVPGPFLTHAGSNTYWYAVIVLAPATESGILVAGTRARTRGPTRRKVRS